MLSSQEKLDYLVSGYLRCELLKENDQDMNEMTFEKNLSMIIIEYFNKEIIKANDNQCRIKKIINEDYCGTTCYGSIKIPSISNTKHHWKFKIHRIDSMRYMALGIDETKYLRYDCGLHSRQGETKTYGSWSDGDKNQWDHSQPIEMASPEFKTGDIVQMILDLEKEQISIKVNQEDECIVHESITVGEDIEYAMAVTLQRLNDEIELLDYTTLK